MSRNARRRAIDLVATLLFFASPVVAATVSMEVAADRGANLNAQREWLQLLADVGVARPRVRTATAGDRPKLEANGPAGREVYRLVGVLDRGGRLTLPGGTFTQRDREKLRDYLDRLKADGREGVLTRRDPNGLSNAQFKSVVEELATPYSGKTAGQPPAAVFAGAGGRLRFPIRYTPGARAKLRAAPAIEAELSGLSVGVTLAIAARSARLALVPTKPRGGAVRLSVQAPAEGLRPWPIGYPVEGPPRNTAPSLMQAIEVEIDGFSLAEAAGAVTPRLKFPVVWDTHTLAARKIVPADVPVKLPRAKLSYKRILEKLLFQARLRGELRTDEAGKPFYWVTK